MELSSPPPVPIDTVLEGRYRVEGILGEGATGVVLLAEDEQLGSKLALKLLHRHLSFSTSTFGRFRNETRVMMSLNHPHIIQTYGLGLHLGEQFYLKMEFLDGTTLAESIEEYDLLSLDQKIVILRDIACAISYAHDRGVIHRDLKPENVLLDKDLRPKIADFGLAQMIQLEARYTGYGNILGTPYYMSPEQINAEAVDGRADMYSFGILAFELMCGRRPFEADSFIELAELHLNATLPALDAPQWLADLISQCCAKRRSDRFAGMHDVLAVLDEYCEIEAHSKKSTHRSLGRELSFELQNKPQVRYRLQKLTSRWIVPAPVVGLLLLLFVILAPHVNVSMQWRYAGLVLRLERNLGLTLVPVRTLFNVDTELQYPVGMFLLASQARRLESEKKSRNQIRALLYAGYDPNVFSTAHGTYPLHLHLKNSDSRVISELLRYGADPNLIDSHQLTALDYAVRSEVLNPQFLIELLRVGADPNMFRPDVVPALAYSLSKSDSSTATILLTQGNARVDIPTLLDRPLLHLAVATGQPELVQLILDRGVSLTEVDTEGRSALEYARTLGSIVEMTEIISALERELEAGA